MVTTIRPAFVTWPRYNTALRDVVAQFTEPEEIRRDDYGPDRVHTRGAVLQRVFAYDVYHCAELNETLGKEGLGQLDLWA